MSPRPVRLRTAVATLAGVLIAATVLTGCGRAGLRDDAASDPPTGTVQESPSGDLDSIADDLAEVDEALDQSAGDAGAGDDAAATDDEP